MRIFRVDIEPTREQKEEVLDVLEGEVVGVEGYLIRVNDAVPSWLADAEELILNIPGEPQRCRNCGEPI